MQIMGEWRALIDELDAWTAAGLTATFWWRDDDGVAPTEQLDRLLATAEPLPIALAIISGWTTKALAERLDGCQRITVLQHGWHHTNHGSPTMRTEYSGDRPADDVMKELRQGRERMSALFGKLFQPVFVPPWYHFDDTFLPLLLQSGLWSMSRKGARSSTAKGAGIFEGNVHADLLEWQHPPAFVGTGMAIDQLIGHLRQRRLGLCDIDEPTGILTHHANQDLPAYDFIERLAELTTAHKAAKWLRASEIFPADGPT